MGVLKEIWLYVDARAPVLASLEVAVRLARESGARLTLVGAVGRSEDPIFGTSFGHAILRLVRRDREDRLRELEQTVRTSLPRGRTRTLLLDGELPWRTVVARAARDRPDLLVVAGDGQPRGWFASTSQHLLGKCPVPVWSAYPGAAGFPRRALVALEPGGAGSDARLVARATLAFALRLSAIGGVELHVANAWAPRGGAADEARPDAERARERVALQLEHAQAMGRVVDDADARGRVAGLHLRRGDPGVAIPALAEELDADLVIVGSTGRRGLAGLLIGSTAEAILARVTLSVAIVKPPGWGAPATAAAERYGEGSARDGAVLGEAAGA